MERIYDERPSYTDNRQINFIVHGPEAKKDLQWLLSGGMIPQVVGNGNSDTTGDISS